MVTIIGLTPKKLSKDQRCVPRNSSFQMGFLCLLREAWVTKSKMAAKREISELSADELLQELQALGLKTGPITPTTRKIFEKRLSKARGENLNSDIEAIRVISSDEGVLQHNSSDTTDFISSENQINNSPASNTSFYYGVCFDRSSIDEARSCTPTVFTSKREALDAVKKLKDKGARFKPFKTKYEAEIFSMSSGANALSSMGFATSISKVTDPASSFKNPKPQELVKFRKAIEKGSPQDFLDLVNSNPKYLISSGDTPVILQEGFRYNAMHVAAKENKPDICKLIVETLESDRFWQNYLSFDKDTVAQTSCERKQILVDLYLNTPDKGNFETPLHFACKFGHVDVVEYLVSHPLTNVNPRNKYVETPDQVACSRCSSQASAMKIKDKIKHLLEDNYFVPVFGAEGDATPPRIGEPWSPDIHSKGKRTPSYSSPGLHSPVGPRVTVRAYAGPMSPKQAFVFHHQWKTPPANPEDRRKYADIKRGDSTRGLERIGRSLAHSRDIPWTEYWDFLGCYVDFAKPSGMEILENYFSTQQEKITSENFSATPDNIATQDPFSTPASGRSDVSDVFISDKEDSSPLYGDRNSTTNIMDKISPTFQHRDHPSIDCIKQINSLNTKSPLPSQTEICDGSQGLPRARALALDFEKLSISPQGKANESGTKDTLEIGCLSETPNTTPSMKSPGYDHKELNLFLCKKNLFDDLNESGNTEDRRTEKEMNLVDMRIQNCFIKSGEHGSEMLSKEKDNLIDLPKLDLKLLGNTTNIKESCTSTSEMAEDKLAEQPEKLVTENKNEYTTDKETSIDLKTSSLTSISKGLDLKESQSSPVFDSAKKNRPCVNEQESSTSDTTQDNQMEAGCTTTPNHKYKPRHETKEMMLFIDGSIYPSKLDLDVLRALNGVPVLRDKYPLVARWRDMVTSYSSTVRESWPSPGSPLYRKRQKSMLAWTC